MTRFLSSVWSYRWDVTGLVGVGLVIVGTYTIYPPAAWLVAGLCAWGVAYIGASA